MLDYRGGFERFSPREHPHRDRRGWIAVAVADWHAGRVAHFDDRARLDPGGLEALDRLGEDPRIAAAHRPVAPRLENHAGGIQGCTPAGAKTLTKRATCSPQVLAVLFMVRKRGKKI